MKNKRVLAILLAVCMILQTAGIDTTVFASEATTESYVNDVDEAEVSEPDAKDDAKEDSADQGDMSGESNDGNENSTDESEDEKNDNEQNPSESVDTPDTGDMDTSDSGDKKQEDSNSQEGTDSLPEDGSEDKNTETDGEISTDPVEDENTVDDPGVDEIKEEKEEKEEEDLPDTLTWKDEENGVQVTVSGDLDSLNGAADISVKKLPAERVEEYKTVISAENETADDTESSEEDDNFRIKQDVYVYDITLLNSDGKEIEPAGDVSVEFSVEEIKAALTDKPETEIAVYHNLDTVSEIVEEETENDEKETLEDSKSEATSENEKEDSVEQDEETQSEETAEEAASEEEADIPVVAASLQKLDSEVSEDGVITIVTDSFSEYALVLTGKTSQKQTSFGDGEYLELDKYIEETGKKNNQKKYDIYLENAYYKDGSPVKIKQYAPMANYTLLITDQSSSMKGEPVNLYNEAIQAYVDRLVEINQARIQAAKNGEYTDIDPNSKTIEQDMADHLFYIAGCIGFNQFIKVKQYNGNESWDVAPLTEEEADALKTVLYVKNDFEDYLAGKEDTDMADGTKTYLALDRAYEFLNAHSHYGISYNHDGSTRTVRTDQVLLVTDGGPNRVPNPEQATINASQNIKDLGVKVFGVFENYGGIQGLEAAVDAQDIMKLSFDNDLRAITLGLVTSDSPKGGTVTDTSFSVNSDPDNTFGKYTNFHNSLKDLTDIMVNVAISQITESNTSVKGYASDKAYIKDTVTDPFEITDPYQIEVYAVPRVPTNLDENNIPVGVETDILNPDYGIVKDFAWANRDEWIDIKDQVSLTMSGNTIKVTGWDYEKNAVRNYDKDLESPWPSDSAMVYKTGDYGYKIVVVIPINAKITFGGNHIETNNSETSAFYPSDPIGYKESDADYLPKWKNNTSLNPGRKDYIESYPVPYVDLDINYKVASDTINVYAPQTAELHNLVTDTYNSLWYTDKLYNSAKMDYDNAYVVYKGAYDSFQDRPDDETLEIAYYEAYAKYLKAQQKLETCESYIPDGINNAFVDISYKLSDPDGQTVATMYIPHGKPYIEDTNGNRNIDWVIADGSDGLIKKSGKYTITCTVSPVDTVKAPGGHISTEKDSADTRKTIPYDSQAYSPTGSSAAGSQGAKVITEETAAYLYQLKITTADTRLVPKQTLDFNQGNEDLSETKNPHILKTEWVCTDGKTASVKENEPGVTGLLQVGDGGVIITNLVPDQARADGLVESILGTDAAGSEDGIYVPVGVTLSRKTGNVNKSCSTQEQTKQTLSYMGDDDQIYGEGFSSVIWDHICDIVADADCNTREFADAQKYSTAADGTATGIVRYLIHVENNPFPEIKKVTTTPVISKGNDILWDITLTNDNETENEKHNASDFSLVDVLPYNGDGRIDPNTNLEGSKFGGELQYKKVKIDFTGSPTSATRIQNGTAALYYTSDTAVRTADESQILGNNVSGNINWTKVAVNVSGKTAEVTIPAAAVAIKLETRLLWNEKLQINLTANIQVANTQKTGDRYHNQAFVYNGNGGRASDVVVTTVPSPYVSGIIWEDTNNNGIMDADEPRIEDIVVTLYRKMNSYNGGTPDRVIGGIKLEQAYTSDLNKFAPVVTGTDGSFVFDDIAEGTYYIVADNIPDQYQITVKGAGKNDANLTAMDSKAETSYVTNTDKKLDNTAWIKEITITHSSVPNQNIGLNLVRGTVTVGKTVDEIYYPSSMTDEEREDYQLVFHFELKNTQTGRTYTQSVRLTNQNYMEKNGKPQVYCKFVDIPLGTYTLSEVKEAQYAVDSMSSENASVSYNSSKKTSTIKITPQEHEFTVNIKNKLIKDPPGGDENGVDNWINVRIPVSLEIKYIGPDPISSNSLTEYTFKRSDFDDMIVTYDDGTQISLKKGTLKFEQVALSPATVTNAMNSGTDKIAISGYYSEKGRTVKDSFRVKVNLKPVHKFQLNFDANGSTFNDGSSRNNVLFAYDDSKNTTVVTKGTYKDRANGLLNARSGDYRFVGWNTRNDGTGVNYDGLSALNAIGKDQNVSVLTLYARWTTTVTFNANGGTITGGSYSAEQALAGKASGSLQYNVNQTISTGLSGNKSGYSFVLWNTKPDGTGTNLKNYGRITGPVTFYAIYYRTDYAFTGDVQTFTAPVDGWYQVQLWGADGGALPDQVGGKGGYTRCYVHLKAKDYIYVFVGGSGVGLTSNEAVGGWNGGGYTITCKAGFHSGSGGGMTHISYTNNLAVASPDPSVPGTWNPEGTIAVAGGGGGGGNVELYLMDGSKVGHAGGLVSNNTSWSRSARKNPKKGLWKQIDGSTQTSGYAQGVGQACANSSGGGAGWWGGNSAGFQKPVNGGKCGFGAAGGTGYITPAAKTDGFAADTTCQPGDGAIPTNPTPIAQQGYARFQLVNY